SSPCIRAFALTARAAPGEDRGAPAPRPPGQPRAELEAAQSGAKLDFREREHSGRPRRKPAGLTIFHVSIFQPSARSPRRRGTLLAAHTGRGQPGARPDPKLV